MTALTDTDLVLASTSSYRRDLLRRLGAPFRQESPDVDESILDAETPSQMALRLAIAKAHAVATSHRHVVIIGSDQVAECNGRVLGKPGDAARACEQLAMSSGRRVIFHTAICLLDTRRAPARELFAIDITTVAFRTLRAEEIMRYVTREQPLDCAGSFKCEGLGITLFESIQTQDPTALIGLPLIALCRLLRELDIEPI